MFCSQAEPPASTQAARSNSPALAVLGMLLLLLGATGCHSAEAHSTVDAGAVASGQTRIAAAATPERAAPPFSYVERMVGGAKAGDRVPLLVALHGLGDTPENFVHVFEDVSTPARVIAVRAPDPWGEGTSWYPIDAGEREKMRRITARADALAEFIGELAKARPTRGKAVVSGFSQGGVLSFALAAYHAQKLFAALPIAGALPEGMPAPGKAPPWFSLVAFHGQSDRRIPFADGERTFARLEQAGFRGSLVAFSGVGHGIPPAMQAQITQALDEQLDRAAR